MTACRDLYLSWGIYQVLRGVAFLNVDAKLRHNNLHGNAIYVNAAGDWKLFGFEIMDSIGMFNGQELCYPHNSSWMELCSRLRRFRAAKFPNASKVCCA